MWVAPQIIRRSPVNPTSSYRSLDVLTLRCPYFGLCFGSRSFLYHVSKERPGRSFSLGAMAVVLDLDVGSEDALTKTWMRCRSKLDEPQRLAFFFCRIDSFNWPSHRSVVRATPRNQRSNNGRRSFSTVTRGSVWVLRRWEFLHVGYYDDDCSLAPLASWGLRVRAGRLKL